MITGFNTDVEYEGVVYHVQTEDKGLESPLILSLVYAGGAILASKRSPYEDLIAAGFDEAALAQRLKRQHRLICAAINAGRIEDLKRMGGERPAASEATTEPTLETTPEPLSAEPVVEANAETPAETIEPKVVVAPPAVQAPSSPYTVHDSRRYSPLGEKTQPSTGLAVSIIDEREFRSGQSVTIKLLVQRRVEGGAEPVVHAAVSIKVLGTGFRPQMYSVTTDHDGVATIATDIPTFNSGRAAIIIRVDAAGASYETRRVIQPGR